MLVDGLLLGWVVPLPLQIHSFSLLLGHQTNFVVFVADQIPLLVLTSSHGGVYGVIGLSASKFCLCAVEVEGIF